MDGTLIDSEKLWDIAVGELTHSARVLDIDAHAPAVARGDDAYASARRLRLHGVEAEIQQHLTEQIRVRADGDVARSLPRRQ